MNCEQTAEFLPWYVNNSLAVAEQEMVREHLAECAACQKELAETDFAFSLFQQHVPVEALVDYAFKRPLSEGEPEVIERHLADCQECSEQLGLVGESRRLEGENVVPFHPLQREVEQPKTRLRKVRVWQYGMIAASIFGFIALGGWLWNWQQTRELRASLAERQHAASEGRNELASENLQLRRTYEELRQQQQAAQQQKTHANEELARLEARIKELTAPQLNIPVLEVFPQDAAQRGGQTTTNQLRIPANVRIVTLILNSQSAVISRSYEVEILAAQNRTVWSGQGLVRHATGDYTINVPAEMLPAGDYVINVYGNEQGRRVRLESYRIRLAHTR